MKQDLEYILDAHDHANTLRSETKATIFLGCLPWDFSSNLGIFSSYIYGHDNYNLRFVDSGYQVTFGFTWDMSLEVNMKQP